MSVTRLRPPGFFPLTSTFVGWSSWKPWCNVGWKANFFRNIRRHFMPHNVNTRYTADFVGCRTNGFEGDYIASCRARGHASRAISVWYVFIPIKHTQPPVKERDRALWRLPKALQFAVASTSAGSGPQCELGPLVAPWNLFMCILSLSCEPESAFALDLHILSPWRRGDGLGCEGSQCLPRDTSNDT
jgi:hypothetical protein